MIFKVACSTGVLANELSKNEEKSYGNVGHFGGKSQSRGSVGAFAAFAVVAGLTRPGNGNSSFLESFNPLESFSRGPVFYTILQICYPSYLGCYPGSPNTGIAASRAAVASGAYVSPSTLC